MRAAQGTLSPGGTTEPLRVPEPCAELGAWDAPTNPSRGPPSIARTGNLWCLRGREVPGGALAAPTLKGTHTSFVAVMCILNIHKKFNFLCSWLNPNLPFHMADPHPGAGAVSHSATSGDLFQRVCAESCLKFE